MEEVLKFDYYYGTEAEQFTFYRVPRLLIKDKRFKDLSSDAKLLYGLMLDRMSLSIKNGWLDEENRAYIFYTLDNIMEDLGCAREKCARVLAELDDKKGMGLIRKKRQGLGKPDIIYVMNFASLPDNSNDTCDDSAEVRKPNFKKFENHTSESSELRNQEVRKSNSNKNKNNYNKNSYNDHINHNEPSEDAEDGILLHSRTDMADNKPDMIDTTDEMASLITQVRKNLEYEHHLQYDEGSDREIFKEIYDVVCDIVCVKRDTVRINGEDYPYELVRDQFLKLNNSHVEYVKWCMNETTSKIANIRAYLITTLYNAPTTMNHYYKQKVQHDLYGRGEE